jgi:hypothetical protein
VEVVLLGRRATMRHRALFGSDPFARAHSLLNHFPITKRAKSEMEASIHSPRTASFVVTHTHHIISPRPSEFDHVLGCWREAEGVNYTTSITDDQEESESNS